MAKPRTINWLRRLGLFLDKFSDCFVRPPHRVHAQKYLTGLLGRAERKNILGLGQDEHGSAGYQALQHFVTHANWQAADVWCRLREMRSEESGILILDDTGFPKQGRHSVGVDRQYSGTLGQVGNCQVAVSAVLRVGNRTFPMGMDLYLPEEWINDQERREKVGIPVEFGLRTKGEMALDQVRATKDAGIGIEHVVADAGYGSSFEFREALAKLGLLYVVAIKSTNTAFVVGGDRESAVRVRELARRIPEGKWRRVTWRRGTKGLLRAEFAMLQVHQGGEHGRKAEEDRLGLLCERDPRNPTDQKEWKYYFTNLPWGTPLTKVVKLAHSRWAIEQSYQQMKEELGLDHFEGRGFAGFHRHTVLTALSYTFLQLERQQQRGKSLPSLPELRDLVKNFIAMVTILTTKKLRREFEWIAREYPNTS